MKEFDFIARHIHSKPDKRLHLGVGDDAAIIRPESGEDWHVASDMLVEGRHSLPQTDPYALGYKSLAVNLSDMAAMGAKAQFALLSMAIPKMDEAWLAAYMAGFYDLADRFGVSLIGGDTTQGPLTLSISVLGYTIRGQALRRDQAKPNDDIWISGDLGLAATGFLCLRQDPPSLFHCLDTSLQQRCIQALHYPEPRLALGEALLPYAHAALDISDGLWGDLQHILRASNCGAIIDEAALMTEHPLLNLPPDWAQQLILCGGDDYELCFTAPATSRSAIEAIARDRALSLKKVGRIVTETGLSLIGIDGRSRTMDHLKAYEHFSS